jgi:hypothetical protein
MVAGCSRDAKSALAFLECGQKVLEKMTTCHV